MLFVTVLAAFAFARLNFRGKDLVFTLFLALMMIPNELVIITNFVTITELELRNIPDFITSAFDEALVLTDTARRWFATIGQFSIIRRERDTQLLIPAYDYCLPDKECPGSTAEDDPCALFSRIRFPVEEFFPPDNEKDCEDYQNRK